MINILLVDDEPNILKLSSFVIKALGYNVHTAADGAKALSFLDAHKDMDVIFSDLLMPEIGGFELCQKIGDRYPIIIVSAMLEEFKSDTVYKTQAIDYISKPFHVSFVRQRLAMILYKLGLNPEFKPELAATLGGNNVYKGENVLVLGQSSKSLSENELPRLFYNEEKNFELENIIRESEIIGQTIQKKKGGIRIVEGIDLEKKKDLLKIINRTNLALGDVAGIFFVNKEPSAELQKLFDRVIR